MSFTKHEVLDAVTSLMRRRFDVTGERDKPFDLERADSSALCSSDGRAVTSHRTPKTVTVDLYLPAPLNCAIQFDDATHCTRERAKTFASYPADTPLSFDVRRYKADQVPGSAGQPMLVLFHGLEGS